MRGQATNRHRHAEIINRSNRRFMHATCSMGHRTHCCIGGWLGRLRGAAFCDQDRCQRPLPARFAVDAARAQFRRTFPHSDILVIVDAPAPEFVEAASNKLAQALATSGDLIHGIHPLDSGPFFEQNGLLFLPTEEVARVTGGLVGAKPLIQTLSTDPSLRGSLDALSFGFVGVAGGMLRLDDLASPMTRAADTAEEVLSGRPASFFWRALASG
jgi:hypothetical protein